MNYNRSERRAAAFRLALIAAALVLSAVFPSQSGVGCAAIVATAVINKRTYKSWTLTALDADVTVDIPHGFVNNAGAGVAPDMVQIQELFSYANAALPNWGVTVVDATKITLVKQNATASGGTTPGTTVIAKLFALLPHSLMQ